MVFSPSGQVCKAETYFLVKFSNETFLIFDTAACLLVILKYYERKYIFWGCLDCKADGRLRSRGSGSRARRDAAAGWSG